MDIQKLKYFCCVARHLNFSKAAEECHIAQTAMSRSIAKLEEELGFRLFDRTHHYVELSPAGAFFLPEAMRIVSAYEYARQTGIEISNTSTTRLSIAFGGYDRGFARFYVGRFMKAYPQCSISLRSYPYDEILEPLISGICDILFVPEMRIRNKENIRSVTVSDSLYVIGVGRPHPLFALDEVTPEQLEGQTFIHPSNINMSWDQKNILGNIFDHYGFRPGRVTRSNSALGVVTMVELGMGLTFMSEDVEISSPDVKLLPIRHDNPTTKHHVAAALTPAKRPIIGQFLDFVEAIPFQKGERSRA